MTDITDRLRARKMQQAHRSPGDRTTRLVVTDDPLCQLAADEIDRLRAELELCCELKRDYQERAARAYEALEIIATPARPDGTYNRDRRACELLARDALGEKP